MELIIEQLDTACHDRNAFDCGVDELNIFLKQHANQNQSKNISKTYVAVVVLNELKSNTKKILGYYTLSAGQIYLDQLPDQLKNKLPKYPVPIARIGRLAVDKVYKNQGIGGFLLHDAFSRIISIAEKMGIFAVVVDAKNDNAKYFYKKYGFEVLQDSGLTLLLPISTIKIAIKQFECALEY